MHSGNITKNIKLPDSVIVFHFLATILPLHPMWGTGDAAATSESDAFIIRELRKYYEKERTSRLVRDE